MEETLPNVPRISIIIPVYNFEAVLAETLESALNALPHELEIIVVDDGSTDQSSDIARKYAEKDSRFRVITQTNAGPAAARNHGIREAKAAFILPLDGDDLIDCSYPEKAIALLEKNPEIKVVSCNASFFGNKTGEWRLPPFSRKKLAIQNLIHNCSVFRKSDWEKVNGYSEEIAGREDWDFWISMLKDGGEVYQIPETLFFYRIRENSKRVADRKFKKQVIEQLNQRHSQFFRKQLGGPLRFIRQLSPIINFFCKK